MSLTAFLTESLEPGTGPGVLDVVHRRLVRIEVDGAAWIARGSLVAYHGALKFHLEPVVQSEGVHLEAGPIRSAIYREAVPIARVEGRGTIYVSNDGMFNRVIALDDQTMYVASRHLLAFEPTVHHELRILGAVGLLAGGLIAVRLSGRGRVAISTNGEHIAMRVTPGRPVSADPAAVVGWTDGLWPELKTDLEWLSIVGHGGGEPVQMLFSGDGFVIVNARPRRDAMRTSVLGSLMSKAKDALV